MSHQENIIVVNKLKKEFRIRGNQNALTGLFRPEWQYVTAVNGASFVIKRGEAVAFLGPNGAGKTTTTKMLSGIMYPTSGAVQVLGHTPQTKAPAFLQRIGLVMGNKSGLNWDLSARQSYQLLQEIYRLSNEQFDSQLQMLSELLRIDAILDRQVRQLSLGERMKVELAGALLHDPEVLFLDEPTIGLDIDTKHAVRQFLIELQKRKNVTIILTSHDMDDIEHVCQRVLVINQGELVFDDSLVRLSSRYASKRYIRLTFDDSIDPALMKKHGAVVEHNNSSVLLQVSKKDVVRTVGELAADSRLNDISIESVPLERIMSDLFRS